MTKSLAHTGRSNRCYFERTPERLVLEGYRHWSAGYETGSIEPWELAWSIYAAELGSHDGRRALSELSGYVRTLRKCATCPLRSFPFNSRHLCREECLTMGLIAGLQHESDAVDLCLGHLACRGTCDIVEDAARRFAETLSGLEQVMLPIPRHVIEDIATRPGKDRFH